MGHDYLTSPVTFLIDTLFGLYTLALLLRFILGWVRADFYNPVCQFLVKITNPPVIFTRRFIPSLRGIDLATLSLVLLLNVVSLLLIMLLNNSPLNILSLLIMAITKILQQGFNILTFSLIIQAVLSWVSPAQSSPVSGLLTAINEPLLKRIRRFIPPLSGLDLSVLFALILLQFVKMLILPPLMLLSGY